ncbi:ferrioxamine B transporter [Rhinocladiella similis]
MSASTKHRQDSRLVSELPKRDINDLIPQPDRIGAQAMAEKGYADDPSQISKRDEHEESHRESPGVSRMTAIANVLTTPKRVSLYLSFFIAGYAFGLDYLVRNTYLAYATASYQQHSLLATVNVIRAVVVAALQPSLAKLADVFGRLEVFIFGVVVYTVGSIVEACANNVESFAGGAILYQLGYTTSLLIIEIMLADVTAVKNRLFFAFLPNFPYMINSWISGNVTSATLSATTWRWGIGMFCIIYPVCVMPLIVLVALLGRQVRKTDRERRYPPLFSSLRTIFWELDIIGVFLLTASLAMIMIPLTLAGGVGKKWTQAGILTPLILGVALMPGFLYWEHKSSHPLLPFYLFKDRMVWACLVIGCFCVSAYMTHASYLYTLLIVSYDFSVESATRIASVYSFCAVLSAALLGLVVMKVRRLKAFILGGVVISFVGVGLLVKYRGGPNSKAGVIAGEVIVGVAGGFFPYPSLVLIQTVTKHQHVGILIGLMFTVNFLGQAIGGCVSGAIWTQTLYEQLSKNLAPFNNASLAPAIYAAPFYVVPEYPIGSPQRDAIIASYSHIQRLLTTTAVGLTVPVLIGALFLRDPILADGQSQPEAERPRGPEVAHPEMRYQHWTSRLWRAFWS